MRITIIGHSTVLIEAVGKKILTDPYFSTGFNPIYRRLIPPARTRKDLSDVDLVLVSHLHFDHVDLPYLSALPKAVPVAAPVPTGALIAAVGRRSIRFMRPGSKLEFGPITVTAVPAVHMDFTVSYVIQAEGKAVYFAGDTFYYKAMRQIGEKYHLSAALLPVTTFRLPMTMDNQGALKAVRDLCPEVVIPIHQSLQGRLPVWRRGETPEGFKALVEKAGLPTRVTLLKEGKSAIV